MAKQRYVNTKFWDDGYVVTLKPLQKLLFLYAITNPLTNICGAYEISINRIAFDTGLEAEQVEDLLTAFEVDGKIIYREGWLLIPNFIKNQTLTPKILIGIEEAVKCCPNWIKDTLSNRYERLSHLNSNSNINTNTNSNSHTDTPSADIAANDQFNSQVDEILSAVKEVYGTNILDREDRWLKTAEKIITGTIPIPDYIAELKLQLYDTNRKFNLTPENVLTAVIEKRAKQKHSTPIINPPENRNAEMEARGLPKVEYAN